MLNVRDVVASLARQAAGGLVSVPMAARALGVSSRAASTRLERLVRSGWVSRVRRGLYLVRPLESSPSSPATVEDPWILARVLFSPCYVGGWSAAEHWGLTDQIFRPTFVVTAAPRRRQKETYLAAEFYLVRVRPERLRGAVSVWRGSERISLSDRERTIADAMIDPSWLGGVQHLAEIFAGYRRSKHADQSKLLDAMAVNARGAAYKRLGYLAETLWPDADRLIETALAHKSAGNIRLEPAIGARGTLKRRWGLWVNTTIRDET